MDCCRASCTGFRRPPVRRGARKRTRKRRLTGVLAACGAGRIGVSHVPRRTLLGARGESRFGAVAIECSMAMGKKHRSCSQEPLWVAGADLPRSAGHPFYERLNGILDAGGFDEFAESACAVFYAERMGRPSLAPGRYFRLLLLGYFEGLDSERGMAWRAQDSRKCSSVLGLGLSESSPDHSFARVRRQAHRRVFSWVLGRLAESACCRARRWAWTDDAGGERGIPGIAQRRRLRHVPAWSGGGVGGRDADTGVVGARRRCRTRSGRIRMPVRRSPR